jgi:hypothetical protein
MIPHSLVPYSSHQHSNIHGPPPIKLRAVLEGDNLRLNNFLVEIQPTKTISELKDVIKLKKSHALNGIDVDQVQIYKVHMPIKDAMANLSGEELFPADDVQEHWATQPPLADYRGKYVHIVVRGSSTIGGSRQAHRLVPS